MWNFRKHILQQQLHTGRISMNLIVCLFRETHWERRRKQKDFYSWKDLFLSGINYFSNLISFCFCKNLSHLVFLHSFRISWNLTFFYVCERFSRLFFVILYRTKRKIRRKIRNKIYNPKSLTIQ
jgi:hypothetical protein